MEFWGVEVKAGQPLKVTPQLGKVIHISQGALGEGKKEKGNDLIPLRVKINGEKFVVGSLSAENFPQVTFDLVFEKDFELSHDWKNGSVYFCGYSADNPFVDDDEFESDDSSDDEDIPLPLTENGKIESKVEEVKPAASKGKAAKPESVAKPKVTVVEPKKDDESDDDDSDDSFEDDSDDEQHQQRSSKLRHWFSSEDVKLWFVSGVGLLPATCGSNSFPTLKMSSQPPSQSPTTTKSKGKASQNSQPSQGFKAHWDTKSTEIFVKLCVEQVKAGHRPGTHLDRVGWEAVIDKFKIATGKSYVRIQLKNRWDTLKKEWGLWKNLLRGETRLGLDPLTGAIMASDDWWNLKLQRYPDAAKFREKPLTLADDMDILFSDVSATGEWAYTPSSGVFLDTEGSHTPLGDDTDTEIHPSELSNQCRRQKEGPSKKQKGNKKQSAAGELTLNRIVDAVEASSSTGTQNAAMQNPHTITECLAKISTISGVSEDDELLVWAARLFMKPSLRESFMALPNDVLRLKFINLEIALEKARIPGFRD